MKKIVVVLLSLTLISAFTGCTSSNNGAAEDVEIKTQEVVTSNTDDDDDNISNTENAVETVSYTHLARKEELYLSLQGDTIFPPQEEHLHTSMLYKTFIISTAFRFFNVEMYFLHPSRFLQRVIFFLLFLHDSRP